MRIWQVDVRVGGPAGRLLPGVATAPRDPRECPSGRVDGTIAGVLRGLRQYAGRGVLTVFRARAHRLSRLLRYKLTQINFVLTVNALGFSRVFGMSASLVTHSSTSVQFSHTGCGGKLWF
jgi:hypothetical protein